MIILRSKIHSKIVEGLVRGLVVFSFSSGVVSAEGARVPTPAPSWARTGRPIANESYLVGLGVNTRSELNDEIFTDPEFSRAMRTEYETRVDQDEARAHAGLSTPSEEKSRFAVMKDFAKRAVDNLSKVRLKMEGDRLTKAAMNSKLPREPIAVVVLAASFYAGRSMNLKIFKDRPISSRIVLKDRAGSLSMPLISGLTSSVIYNHGSEVAAQLSKQVTPNVAAIVDSSQKGNAQVVYSVSF